MELDTKSLKRDREPEWDDAENCVEAGRFKKPKGELCDEKPSGRTNVLGDM